MTRNGKNLARCTCTAEVLDGGNTLRIREKKKKKKDGDVNRPSGSVIFESMENFSRRGLDRIYSAVLLAVVVLSWSFVIYASRMASLQILTENYLQN